MAVLCFNFQERLVPYVRAETARALAKAGMRQERIAEHLGVSQAMVSRYLRQPARPFEGGDVLDVRGLIAAAVDRATAEEARGGVGVFCSVCTALEPAGVARADGGTAPTDHCVRHDGPVSRQEQEAVLRELSAAETRLRRLDARALQPAVRMNLAMSLPDAQSVRDVAAFPGRLVELHGRVASVSPPEFGSSSHLAELLLQARRDAPEVRAILNVRWDDEVSRAVEQARLRTCTLDRRQGRLDVRIPRGETVDALVDPGAFGIEPNLYLLGPSPSTVAETAARLIALLSEQAKKLV